MSSIKKEDVTHFVKMLAASTQEERDKGIGYVASC